MAIKVDYVVRETGSNIFRNFTITLASVLTVMVSLFLVGFSFMLGQGVENATRRWQGGIEFIVFLNPNATQDQVQAVDRDLKESTEIEKVTFVDQNAAYEEFKQLFAGQQDLLESVTPDVLPPSYRVVPRQKDAQSVEALSVQFRNKAGVKEVVSATETIRLVQQLSSRLTLGIVFVSAFLLLAAFLLILNTIRMAIYARRREIEVMKLVGATNWFIRVPFMVEGLVQGIVGALLAILGLLLFKPFFEQWLPPADQFPLFSGFVPAGSQLLGTYFLLGVTGMVVGAIGAGIAVTRFLDV
ncbi:MAG: permease-like cell division protein FtsX [Acidimicrobiales bacterium]